MALRQDDDRRQQGSGEPPLSRSLMVPWPSGMCRMSGRPSAIKKPMAKTVLTVATHFGGAPQVRQLDAQDYMPVRAFSTASGFLAMTVR
jgi:hypothetical protein